jgi:hypothetical protein
MGKEKGKSVSVEYLVGVSTVVLLYPTTISTGE